MTSVLVLLHPEYNKRHTYPHIHDNVVTKSKRGEATSYTIGASYSPKDSLCKRHTNERSL
eukprot:scaffold1600_cov179-Amphora_coffeaeformis.AAC.19